jgi:hypothetical protein
MLTASFADTFVNRVGPGGAVRDVALDSETWSAQNSPYVIEARVQVNTGATLTIEPGVTVLVNAGRGIYVEGALAARGTTFNVRETGNWLGIYLGPAAGASLLDGCTFRAAGGAELGYFNSGWRRTALYLNQCSPTITNCRIESSGGHGLEVFSSRARVENNTFADMGNGYYAVVLDTTDSFLVASGNTAGGTGHPGIAVPRGAMSGTNTLVRAGQDFPYYLNGELTLPEDAILTVAPGVTLLTQGQRIIVAGTLKAVGTTSAPITFGSRSATPAPGDWLGLYFSPTAGNSALAHLNVSHAGASDLGYFQSGWRRTSVFLDNCSPSLNQVRIVASGLHGLELHGASPSITASRFEDCRGHALVAQAGSRPTLDACIFVRNGAGGNGYHTVWTDASSVPLPTNAQFQDNPYPAILNVGGRLPADATWRRWADNVPYFLNGDVTVDAAAALTIDPGVTVKVQNRGLYVNGVLNADGASAPITFTSWKDDTVAGDSNGDQAATAPVMGDWRGIYLSPQSGASVLNRCTLNYAGQTDLGYYNSGWRRTALYVDACAPQVTRCQFLNSGGHGLEVMSSPAVVRDNHFENLREGWYAMVYDNLVAFPRLSGNTLAGTGVLGIAVPGGTIPNDAQWDLPGPDFPYFMNAELTLAQGVTWRLAPGVTVKSFGQRLVVHGSLMVDGTAASPVTFTSRQALPAGNDWLGIYLSPSAGGSVLNHLRVEYAGRDALGYFASGWRRAGLLIEGSSPTVNHLSIADSGNHGLYLIASNARCSDLVVERAATYGIVLVSSSRPTLDRARLTQNGSAKTYTVYTEPNCVPVVSGVVFDRNYFPGIEVVRGEIQANSVWQRWNGEAPYVITGDVTLRAGSQLTIEPGAVVKFANTGLYLNGTLVADGTAEPIVLTSWRDDVGGVDSNGDGEETVPAPGNWRGIYLSPDSGRSILKHCTVRYAGQADLGYFRSGWRRTALYVDAVAPTIENCRIDSIAAHGIELYASAATIRSNRFEGVPKDWFALVFDTHDTYPRFAGNSATGDGWLGIYVPPGTMNSSGEWQNPGAGLSYYPWGDLTINGSLMIGAGCVVRPATGIYVGGVIEAIGTPAEPVVFNGRAAAPEPNAWRGIYLGPNAGNSVLRFCHILNAGASDLGYLNGAWRRSALYVDNSAPQLSDLQIARSGAYGASFFGGNALLASSLISSNAWSGVITMAENRTILANNTIVANTGVGAYVVAGNPTLVNNIIAFGGEEGIRRDAGSPVLSHNLVFGQAKENYRGLEPGATDLSVDPAFLDRAAGNFRLNAASPAINAGDDAVLGASWMDLDGRVRRFGVHVDLGAYESDAPAASFLVDALVRNAGESNFSGGGTSDEQQQARTQSVRPNTAAVYDLQGRYQGNLPDSIRVRGPAGDPSWTVKYFNALSQGQDVTTEVTSPAGLTFGDVQSGFQFELRVEITPSRMLPAGTAFEARVQLQSSTQPSQQDTVLLTTLAAEEYQPDALARRVQDPRFVGNDVYDPTGASQTLVDEVDSAGRSLSVIRVVNDGNRSDSLVVRGPAGQGGWQVRYLSSMDGAEDLTAQVVGGGLTLPSLDPGAGQELWLEISPGSNVPSGSQQEVVATVSSFGNSQARDSIRVVVTAVGLSASPQGGIYTLTSDFAKGVLGGLEAETVRDQLQLARESVTLPFIWVPNSNEGTVSKIDTRTGRELARYRTGSRADGSPSRSTIDQQGNCWLANRVTGTAVKVGLFESGQYVDRNNNGLIETSQDLNGDGNITGDELLPWGQDECVLVEVVLIPGKEGPYVPGTFTEYANDNWNPGPRGVAVDALGNVWLGTYGTKKFYYVESSTGAVLKTIDVSSVNHTSYGALVDAQGIVWSSGQDKRHVLRLDPVTGEFRAVDVGHFVYGLGLGRDNSLYVSAWQESKLSRFNTLTGQKEWTRDGVYESRGVAVTDDGDVWVANSGPGTVARWSATGALKTQISVGNQPTGVAVDADGKVWVVNVGDEFVKRIDPASNKIDLEKRIVGGTHYGYSDMTGIIARNATTRYGVWSVIHNGRFVNAPWGKLSWTASVPEKTFLRTRVRSSSDRVQWSAWEPATNRVALSATPPGQYLQIEVEFQVGVGEASPVLYDLSVEPSGDLPPAKPELSVLLSSSGQVEVSWSTSIGANWDLEHAASLVGTAWQSVGVAPVVRQDRYVVVLPATAATDFFRLRSR